MKHRAMRKRAVIGAVLALSLVAGACGGDDDDDGSSDTDAPGRHRRAEPTPTHRPTPMRRRPPRRRGTDAPAAHRRTERHAGSGDDSLCLVSGDAATGEPIKVGSIQSKTGPDDFSSSGQGAKAFFECVNANGGINGRPVEFLVEDDQWTPEVASQLGAKLVNDEAVVAMVGSSSFVECGVNEPLVRGRGRDRRVRHGRARGSASTRRTSRRPTPAPGTRRSDIAQYMVSEYGAETMTCISQNIPNVGEWVCTGLVEWGDTAGVHGPRSPPRPGQPRLHLDHPRRGVRQPRRRDRDGASRPRRCPCWRLPRSRISAMPPTGAARRRSTWPGSPRRSVSTGTAATTSRPS